MLLRTTACAGALVLLVGCGGPSQAELGTTYAGSLSTQAKKVLAPYDRLKTECPVDATKDACINDIVTMTTAAAAAPKNLAPAPSCMADADTKARAGFAQIAAAGSASIAALAAEGTAQVKAQAVAVGQGADQLVAAATAVGQANCPA